MPAKPSLCESNASAERSRAFWQHLWLTYWLRFVDCEKWRKEIKLDELVPVWDYPEKTDISKYYKQFYHKTDKVGAMMVSRPQLGVY